MENKDEVSILVKEYITLKEHEYKSILSKLNNKTNNFKVKIVYNTYENYKDTHIILNYNYTNYNIREDKFYHTLKGNLIDINHFTRGSTFIFDKIKLKIKEHLKEKHITDDMIELVLKLNKDNFYINSDALTFIYSYSQFGISSKDYFKIRISYKDLYECI